MEIADLIIFIAAWLLLRHTLQNVAQTSGVTTTSALAPSRSAARLAQLSDYADRLYAERKWLAAEKAYLNVLKTDHKNVTAYTHLGVIYSTQKNMSDALECFLIATRLHPSGTTFQNLALAFYDNRNYMKSVAAYEKAIMFEPAASRYLGLAKAQRKLANLTGALASLDQAIKLDSSPKLQNLRSEIQTDIKAGK